MVCIILDPVNTLALSTPCGPVAKVIFNKFTHFVLKAGGQFYRSRQTQVNDATGNVISIDKEVLPFDGFAYDFFDSDFLSFTGRTDTTESFSGKKDAARMYVHEGVDIEAGDYILWAFDTDDETYNGKYEIVEKEGHNVQGCNIFYTLYLQKRIE